MEAMTKGMNMLPAMLGTAATAFLAIGAYEAIKPMAWDALKITTTGGYIDRVVNFLPGTANTNADIKEFAKASLGLATIGGLAYLTSSSKALNLIDTKQAQMAVGAAGLVYALNFLGTMQTLNLGNVFGALSKGNWGNARNQFSAGTAGMGRIGMTGMANQMPLFGAHNQGNYSMGGGAHNQLQTANTAAIQQGSGNSGFFGTRSRLGATRVNLF